MSNTELLISIIIVNFNGKKYLKNCFDSFKNVDYKNYEIIFVDNNSTDDSINFVKINYPNVRILKLDKNYGFAFANNLGAKKAKGDLLLFLNNDTEVSSNFMSELVKAVNLDSSFSIFQSLLLKPDGKIDSSGDFFNFPGLAYSSKTKPESIKPILSARGAAMIVKKDIFWELDGFDKRFFATFEDVDLGWRAWMSGYKVAVVPNSIVYHIGSQTVEKMDSLIKFHGIKNTLILILTNFETGYAMKSFFSFFGYLFRKKSSMEIDQQLFESPTIKTAIHAVCWVTKNLGYILEKRSKVKSTRKRTTSELIKLGLITEKRIE